MVVWKGWGLLALLIPMVCSLTLGETFDLLYGDGAYKDIRIVVGRCHWFFLCPHCPFMSLELNSMTCQEESGGFNSEVHND
jgi:hypothetical protein